MSKMAPGMGAWVRRSVIVPCILQMRPVGEGDWIMEEPRGRKGAWGDQKGPRMEEEVGSEPLSETILLAISSTSLRCIVSPLISLHEHER